MPHTTDDYLQRLLILREKNKDVVIDNQALEALLKPKEINSTKVKKNVCCIQVQCLVLIVQQV
jgi:hypothetical protein